MLDISLLEYCKTNRQSEILQAVIQCGSNKAAAKMLGIAPRNVRAAIQKVKGFAAKAGYAPEANLNFRQPTGFHVRGISTLTRTEAGEPQWIKADADKEDKTNRLLEAITEALESYKGKSSPVPVSREALANPKDGDRMGVYPMGDPHIGMYAWAEETGKDFDCDIAERNLLVATDNLVSRMPYTPTALLLNLGDFFHSDNQSNRTNRSGAQLDVDSRWARVLRIGVKVMINMVYTLLDKHDKVIVSNRIGNHDDHTSQVLTLALALYFERDERVQIEDSPAYFWYYRFGKVLIGSGHGDTAKPDALPGIMATDRAKDWGKTIHRYWYTGHIHTNNRKEYAGCLWESFRTLASKDAWHSSMGYRAGRDMVGIVLHKDHGEVERHTMSISQIETS